MAETIQNVGGGAKWHWYSVMSDLKEQMGLDGVVIDPLSVREHGCGGQYEGNQFYITWVYNQFLLVTMQRLSQPLVEAFSRVVEYQPFCRYDRDGMVTVEWDKNNPIGRLAVLQAERAITNLVTM